MNKFLIAGMVAAQALPSAQPAAAAELGYDRTASSARASAFAGARLRVPLGGGREKPQAGLALTSTRRSEATGELRFARGAELGFRGTDSKLGLSLAGQPVSKLAAGGPEPGGRKQGFSTAGWIAIGASAVIIIGGVLIFDYIGDQSE